MSQKREKSTKPTDQSTQSVKVEEPKPKVDVGEEWTPFLQGNDPSNLIKELDSLIENNKVIRIELQELKTALEEKRGDME